jgi:hypothetical protein
MKRQPLADGDSVRHEAKRRTPLRGTLWMLLGALTLSACGAPAALWVKPGASTADFNQDRYGCMQQSQHRVSTANVNRYGGSADSYVTTNDPLFSACMNALGWSLQQAPSQQQVEQTKSLGDPTGAEIKQLCSREDLKPYFNKSPCNAEDATLEQLTDKSRITQPEKIALSKFRAETAAVTKRMTESLEQTNPAAARVAIPLINTAQAEHEKVAIALYDGRITWGQYTQRRQEIARAMKTRIAGRS